MKNNQKRYAIIGFIFLAVFAVLLRYALFEQGILYGEAAAKMASLAVAGIIILAGYLPLRADKANAAKSGAQRESVAATLAAVLGLALTGYAVSELLAPNTPVAAAAAACSGTPVYGAEFFAKTQANGVNARSGPGVEYPQRNRYGGNCTLGFDGYCIGRQVPDYILGTPDQRWLIVHHSNELVAAGVVLSESPESALGAEPSPMCKKLGGLSQPSHIKQFSYDASTGQISSDAPGAVAVGYGLGTVPPTNRSYQVIHLGTGPGFNAKLSVSKIANEVPVAGGVWLGAAICLADNVPVIESLRVQRLSFNGSHVTRVEPVTHPAVAVRTLLAEVACNSSGL